MFFMVVSIANSRYNGCMDQLKALHDAVGRETNKEKGIFLQRFFKTRKGEYAEGDIFAGLSVPQSRQIAAVYSQLSLTDAKKLLSSKIHEERLIALLILVSQFKNGDKDLQKKIFNLYLQNTKYINNWDLVDLSADKIVGKYLLDKDRGILKTLAHSSSLWEKRIAIIATYQFIIHGEYKDTFKIAEILLNDPHDLIHKAVGWMLREVGKRVSQEAEEEFLKKYYKTMPRTMLRYAIERFPEDKRAFYMKKL